MQNQHPLYLYVIAVAAVWAIILGVTWSLAPATFNKLSILCGGFALGMVAMYIAVHVYSWK